MVQLLVIVGRQLLSILDLTASIHLIVASIARPYPNTSHTTLRAKYSSCLSQ